MQREQQFLVRLYNDTIGRIFRRENYTRFAFEREYLTDPDRSILGLRFEENLGGRHAANLRLPAWFSNLLPEGRLREWIEQARGTSIDREIDLLAQVGHDLPGAVTVLDCDESVPADIDSTAEARATRDLEARGIPSRFSLAGVAMKFSMLRKGDRFTAPGTGEGGDWIIKLPDPDYPDVPLNEFAMMQLARRSGIETPEVGMVHRDQLPLLPDRLWPWNEVFAYAIRRFDRGPDRQLIHVEDLAQVRGIYPEDKYQGAFETVGALVYRKRDTDALREFARRLTFNVLIGNGDAHLKNWSLIYRNRRIPTLSPAYDLVATAVYRPTTTGTENMGLKFAGTRRFERIGLGDFAAMDRKLGASAGLEEITAEFVGRVVEALPLLETDLRDAAFRTAIVERVKTLAGRFARPA